MALKNNHSLFNINISIVFVFLNYFYFYTTNYVQAAEVELTPRIAASEVYTDNVYLTNNDKRDDYILSVSPGITAQLLDRRSGIEASYDPSFVTYHNNSRSDTWRHTANLNGWAELTANTRFELLDAFFYTEDPLPERDVTVNSGPEPITPQNTTVRRGRRKYYTNATRAGLEYNFGEENLANISYTHSLLKNSDNQFFQDNEARTPSAGLQYWFEPKWGIEGQVRYTRGLYHQPNDFVGEPGDDFKEWFGSIQGTHRIDWLLEAYVKYEHTYRTWDGSNEFNDDYLVYNPSVGVDYSVSEVTSLSLNAGYFYREIVNDRGDHNENRSGPSGYGILLHNFADNASIFLSISGGYSSSDFSSQALGFNKYYAIGSRISYAFSPYITGDIFGSYRWAKYLDTEPQRKDKFIHLGTGLTINPLPWLSIRTEYSLRNYNPDQTPGYTENRLFLGVQLQPETLYSW